MWKTIDWLAPYGHWQVWTVIAANLLPLLGIFVLGWDASTLIILYWMETAVVGFWLVARLLFARSESVPSLLPAIGPSVHGAAMAAFITVHAGIFMAGHLLFLYALAGGEWSRHLGSPVAFVRDFMIPSGVWLPLVALFVARGFVTIGEVRAHNPITHLVAGFYARIVLMQFVILLGGFLSLTMGSPVLLLILIVALKLIVEIYWDSVGPLVESAFNQTPRG